MTRRGKGLTREDRLLWSKVARSVAPLHNDFSYHDVDDEAAARTDGVTSPALPSVMVDAKSAAEALRPTPNAHTIDRITKRKLAKGRLGIDGKVDLHGMTQSEAHGILLSFLHRAYAQGRRHVLVVTGKGASIGSDGVLRRQVPQWLSTPAFRGLVSAHEDAALRHGGQGALYVRLRRRPEDGR